MNDITKIDVLFHDVTTVQLVLGANDKHIKIIENILDVKLYFRNTELFIESTDEEMIEKIKNIFSFLVKLIDYNVSFNERDVAYIVKNIDGDLEELLDLYTERKEITKSFLGKSIYPKTFSQKKYVNSLRNKDLVLAIGPAGTGKTYLAVCYAVSKLKDNTYKRIVLTRPVVEAGESLGYLPGDLKEKIDPYLRPLYDALYDTLGLKQTEELIERGVIEIAPLAYMRGRTLENACVILDEAQNTTVNQMKLFLTRLGFNSKMIITGDVTQIDLPQKTKSGLIEAVDRLKGINEIDIIKFEVNDVVRHPLVQKILRRFEDVKN